MEEVLVVEVGPLGPVRKRAKRQSEEGIAPHCRAGRVEVASRGDPELTRVLSEKDD